MKPTNLLVGIRFGLEELAPISAAMDINGTIGCWLVLNTCRLVQHHTIIVHGVVFMCFADWVIWDFLGTTKAIETGFPETH